MATFKYAFYSLVLLSIGNCSPITNDDTPIKMTVPEECKGHDFCSALPDNYDEIQARIRKLIPKDMITEMQHRYVLNESYDEADFSPKDDWHNCPTMKIQEKPAWSRWNETQYDYLVQLDNFEQTFVAVICPAHIIATISNEASDRQCFPDLFTHQRSNSGMKSTCEQRYSKRLLYIYDDVSNELIMKPYEIPVHCSCQLSRTFE